MKKGWLVGMMATAIALGMTACGEETSNTTATATADTTAAQMGVPAAVTDTEAQAFDWTLSTMAPIVVPAGVGGNTGLPARVFAEFAKRMAGVDFIVVNINSVADSMTTSQVLSVAPDGHTSLYGHSLISVANVPGVADYSYTALKLGPIFAFGPVQQMYANPDRHRTLDDFIKAVKTAPRQLKTCTGMDAYAYYELSAFEKAAGIDLDLVDVGSNSDKVAAMLSGQADLMPDAHINCKGYLEAGQFVCLNAPTEERYDLVKDTPIPKEQGMDLVYPNYEFSFYFPRETPDSVITWHDSLVKEITFDPETRKAIKKVEMEPYCLNAVDPKKNDERIYTEIKEIADDLAR